ncbi:MAG: hypothetical protein Q4A65_02455, partial [Bacillota bacterium]|nr:hypothetical protein [Bacillota bacterium]
MPHSAASLLLWSERTRISCIDHGIAHCSGWQLFPIIVVSRMILKKLQSSPSERGKPILKIRSFVVNDYFSLKLQNPTAFFVVLSSETQKLQR